MPDSDSSAAAGSLMAAEIAQQPTVLQGILDHAPSSLSAALDLVQQRRPRFVLIAARGTSDHAALYAKYLVEIQLGLPAGLTSPSTFTLYRSQPDLRDVLVLLVSQSGSSPDLTQTAEAARSLGAVTVAFTNAPGSPLAEAAAAHVDISAGFELAVAATKTYSAQLLSLWLFINGLRKGDPGQASSVPDAVAQILTRDPEIADLAQRYRFADRFILTARGYSYPTAREAALKLMETSYVAAHAFSGADLLHGPVALIDHAYPVIAIARDDVGGRALESVIRTARARGGDVCAFGSPAAVSAAGLGLDVETGTPTVSEDLAPIVDIAALQTLALHIALNRGLDPDAPRGLSKVTRTL